MLVTRLALLGLLALGACKTSDSAAGDAKGGGTAGPPATGGGAKACTASAECAGGEHCTVEEGACDRPPGCGPSDICADVCYGVCKSGPSSPAAGGPGQDTKGTPTQGSPSPGGDCASDKDCRTFSDYCKGCDCRVLGPKDAEPKCDGPGVRCLLDPCQKKSAACVSGKCVLRGAPPAQ